MNYSVIFLIVVGLFAILPLIFARSSFDEFMTVCEPKMGSKCTELYQQGTQIQHIGKAVWDEVNFHTSTSIIAKKIQITDPDMNQHSNEIEKFPTSVWSDTDSKGIVVSVYETGKDTGIFDGIVYFSELPSTGQRLLITLGDKVTAEYKDNTLPYFFDEENLSITDTITIDAFAENTDSNFRVPDSTFFRKSLRTGEAIPNVFVVQIIEGFGASLILLFIIIYAIKKRHK